MILTVTLKNNHQAGGKRQVSKTLTLKAKEVEALRDALSDRPELVDLRNAVEEVSTK